MFFALQDMEQYSLAQRKSSVSFPSFYCRTIPQQIYPLEDAFYRKKKNIAWKDAAGAVAGQFILRYPPGIPLLVPGEQVTQEIVELWKASGGSDEEIVSVIAE